MAQKTYYSERIAQKTFKGRTTKDAYMKAVKWYATNVISKDHLHGIQVEYEKCKDKPVIVMTLYAVIPEQEIKEQHCNICREMHHSFFVNEQTDCSRCNALGLQNRIERLMSIKVEYYKEILRKMQSDEGEGSDEQTL